MKSLVLGCYALTIGAAAALLAGCGGSQPPIGAPGAMPQSRSIRMHTDHSKSWMLPEAKNETLIYAAGNAGFSYVISYKTGKLVGMIDTWAQSVCSDKNGNVYLTGSSNVFEYAHGGTTPIQTLSLPGNGPEPIDCAVDNLTGNLAVTIYDSASGEASVAVFSQAQGTPEVFKSDFDTQFCGYDDKGDLFIDGYITRGTGLGELPNGGNAIVDINLGYQDVGGNIWSVQWDGKYVTLEAITNTTARINRLSISGSTATIVGKTTFKERTNGARGSWIQGSTLLLPWGREGGGLTHIGFWRYPAGGKATMVFTHKRFGSISRLNGVTVSLARNGMEPKSETPRP